MGMDIGIGMLRRVTIPMVVPCPVCILIMMAQDGEEVAG